MSDDFNTGSGASESYPLQCSALRKGGHVLIKGEPCKIVSMSTSKTGKHGHAKVNLCGIGIFDAKKREEICGSTHNMSVPNVTRTEYILTDVDGEGYLSLMDEEGEIRSDLKVENDDELKLKVQELWDAGQDCDILITVLAAMSRSKVIAYKTTKS